MGGPPRVVSGRCGGSTLTYSRLLEPSAREVGPYLGLTPGERQSGDNSPQQRMTKQGDVHLRRLLVQCSQYILGPKGGDCDLRRHGEKLLARGGAHAKQKALTAVARKLSDGSTGKQVSTTTLARRDLTTSGPFMEGT